MSDISTELDNREICHVIYPNIFLIYYNNKLNKQLST